MIETIFK